MTAISYQSEALPSLSRSCKMSNILTNDMVSVMHGIIRRSMPRWTLATLISRFIMSKLDYCNVALAGLPRCDLDRLQSVINAAARITVVTQRYDHITRGASLASDAPAHPVQVVHCVYTSVYTHLRRST